MIIVTYLLAGAVSGFIAGLFGVGGGIIMVPVFIFCFEAQEFDDALLTHMAIASSLACIAFTSLSSARKHHLLGGVDWAIMRGIAPSIMLGSVAGVVLALQFDGDSLRVLLGLFAIFVAYKISFATKQQQIEQGASPRLLAPVGAAIGAISALFGIGGGTLSVPFFYRLGMPMPRVVGTAAACGFPIALAGVIANGLAPVNTALTPSYSWGLVYLPAVFIVSIASMYFARIGAQSAQIMDENVLKKLFAVCLFCVGLKFIFF